MRQGDRLEDFSALLDDGLQVTLFDLLKNGPLAVFFYPKAFTPGCTAEACHFRDLTAEFAAVGGQRIGVSRDDVTTQAAFRERYDLDFPLMADPDGSIASRFGAKRPTILWSKRQTFVIDTDGTVVKIISSERDMNVHADEALAALAALQTADDPRLEISLDDDARAHRD